MQDASDKSLSSKASSGVDCSDGPACCSDNLLEGCLYFTANSLARTITRMGEEEFSRIGITPSAAFLLTLVLEEPGILQKDLAEKLHLAPSTVSRLVDSMAGKKLVAKDGQGRSTHISPTRTGQDMEPSIRAAWKGLYNRYCAILGREKAEELTRMTREAFAHLDGK